MGPKIVVIGAASYFFGKPAISKMVNSPILHEGTLALVDTDPERLETMMKLARRAIEYRKSPLKLVGSTDRTEVLKDADFVVNTFSFRNTYYRGVDTRISKKYGITMCSGDTIGPGGIFRSLRELPEILRIAKDVERLAPNAWLINFVNPTAVMGIGLMRYAPNVKSFALCDGNHLPHFENRYLELAGLVKDRNARTIPEELKGRYSMKISGVNHFTWLWEMTFDGKDMMPVIYQNLCRKANAEYEQPLNFKAKPRLNMNYAKQMMEIYGAYPTAVSHAKEYVPFFQGHGVSPITPEPLIPFDAFNREDEMQEAWRATCDLAEGRADIGEFLDKNISDHATDIIESMWGNLGKEFFINTRNGGAVSNMPDDAFLELRSKLDMNGPRPLPLGEIPRGILGREMQVLDTHELTAQAAVTCDRTILLRAMMTDPMITNINDAKNIMNELLEIEKDHLPEGWFK